MENITHKVLTSALLIIFSVFTLHAGPNNYVAPNVQLFKSSKMTLKTPLDLP